MPQPHHAPFDAVLNALTAAGEATRLRLLALLAEAELTVSELVTILGQSQPRVSRHLKLLAEAGLVERHREGSWVFFLMSQSGPAAGFARDIVARLAPADPHLLADRARLAEVREARAEHAARYFAAQAANWDEVRAMHLPEERVEAAMLEAARRRAPERRARSWHRRRPHAGNPGAAGDARGRRRSIAANAQRRQSAP